MDDLIPISRPEDDIDNRENSELDARYWMLDAGRSEAEIPRTRGVIKKEPVLSEAEGGVGDCLKIMTIDVESWN